MAREYTRVKLTIWNDPDFRQLTADAQWLYFVLMTHPSISLCGVVDWREARLTAISQDMNISRLRNAAVELGRGRKHQLSAAFVEWMMGLPQGWVTETGISRTEQLKALGNGVVPQQAAEAIRRALEAP